jgi:hypothetical protein
MSFTQLLLVVWDVPLFIFHISMIVMLIFQKIRNNKDLEGGFYVIVIIVGVVDIIAYIEVRLDSKRDQILWNSFIKFEVSTTSRSKLEIGRSVTAMV